MSSTLQQTYDAFPYQSFPFPQSHPDRLATIGTIFGVVPPALAGCRVLELGCAAGGNIIPMAATMPDAQFVGVDFSEVQIRDGRSHVAALGLANLRLEAMDILDFDARFGTFDYIIAHGVYSWVPDPVQEKILALIAAHLSGNGIAYVSYNTLPGWAMRGTVRAAMRYHTAQFADPATRAAQARAILAFLAEGTKDESAAHAVMLRAEAEDMRGKEDYYVLHDYLEEVNQPLYFHQFVERATIHGLRYLGEASFRSMFASDLSTEAASTLARVGPDLVKREQYMDFLRNRMFRQTLLVHGEVTVERKVTPLAVTGLEAASRAGPAGAIDLTTTAPETFTEPEGASVTTALPVSKAALMQLAARWPASVPFGQLREAAMAAVGLPASAHETATAVLASMLLAGYAAGGLELHLASPAFVLEPGNRPATGAWQARQAERGNRVTTLRHELIRIDDATRALLQCLDGTRTREAIATLAWPAFDPAARARLLDEALPQLARQALLVA
ncbi:MAG: class I SAM-dependent methyltransferase [Casimicrobiaceae bacterium]